MSTSKVVIPLVTPDMSLLEAAPKYGKGGLYLAPAVGKSPEFLGKDWPSRTRRDAAGLSDMFMPGRFPGVTVTGMAMHCGRSGVIAFDIDHPEDIPPLLARAIDELKPPMFRTRRNAERFTVIFAMPEGRNIGNSLGELGKGWGDIRGKNAVVILPGSEHPNADEGGEYAWLSTGAVPTLPNYLAELLPDAGASASAVTDADVLAFALAHKSELKLSLSGAAAQKFLVEVAVGNGRHITGVSMACMVAREARAGLYPFTPAMLLLENAFSAELVANPGNSKTRDKMGVAAEFRSIVAYAVAAAMAEPEERMSGIRERVLPVRTSAPEEGEDSTEALTLNAISEAPEEDRKKLARQLIAETVGGGADTAELMDLRDELNRLFHLPVKDFDTIVRESKKTARKDARAPREITGLTLPSPQEPMAVAEKLVKLMPSSGGVSHSAWWRGDFYAWRGQRWAEMGEDALHNWLYGKTKDAVYITIDKEGEETPTRWAPTKKKIEDLTHAMGRGVLHRSRDEDDVKCIACVNGVLSIGTRALAPHTPAVFNLNALPFAYDAEATAPLWANFLESTLPGDTAGQEFLQEWFGYVLSGRTDLQKMAMLIGRERSGKGTIARVLTAMLGEENVSGPTIQSLGSHFGQSGLIGKSLATMGDVRWQSKEVAPAVPILLGISGEDRISVPRKNREDWRGTLGVRFMMMSNDVPSFSDSSGALVRRFVMVSFRQSFIGREDNTLTEKLLAELPGILNWALDGLDRLNSRGRFTESEASAEDREETRRASNAAYAFGQDECEIKEGEETPLDALYEAFSVWRNETGRAKEGSNRDQFCKKLISAFPDDLTTVRRGRAADRVRVVTGVRLTRDPWPIASK